MHAAASPCLRLQPLLLLFLAAPIASASPPAAKPERLDVYGDPLPDGALARLGTIRFREGFAIKATALSPDGKALAVASQDDVVRLLDAGTGKELRQLKSSYAGGVFQFLAFVGGGRVLAGVSEDGRGAPRRRVQFWDAAMGKAVSELTHTGVDINSYSFSADGTYLAGADEGAGGVKRLAHVWDAVTGKKVAQVEVLQQFEIRTALSGDGKVLATFGAARAGEANQTVQFWDVATGKELRRLRDEECHPRIFAVAFAPDGKTVATASVESPLVVWDMATGRELRRFSGRRGVGASLAFSPDGKLLAARSYYGVVQVWDAAGGKRRALYEGPPGTQAAFTGDGRLLAWSNSEHSIQMRDVLAEKSLTPPRGHDASVTALRFTADGKGVVSVAADYVVCSWDAATGKETRRVSLAEPRSHPYGDYDPMKAAVLSPDGKHVLCGDSYGWRLFELDKAREVCALGPTELRGRDGSAAFWPDARLVATGRAVSVQATVIRIHDVDKGQQMRRLQGPPSQVQCLAVAPDGKALAAGTNNQSGALTNEVRVWDVETGKPRWQLVRPHWQRALAFSPDGKVLAGDETDGAVTLWDAATGRELRRLEPPSREVTSLLAFSPDGRLLVAAGHQHGPPVTVRVWEVTTGTARQEFTAHQGFVGALDFAPDGKTLATGAADTSVLLWDLTGQVGEAAKGRPSAEELDKLWAALDSRDARPAFQAMRRLLTAPDDAVALVQKNLKPIPGKGVSAETIAQLIQGLESDSFDEREKATRELEGLGTRAEAGLRKALEAGPSAERKRRIEGVLEKLQVKALAPELVRPLRAVEVLERLGTPEARKVLEALAKGQAEAPLTQAAKGALHRLGW
jgi:WD40 repeat protein